MKIGAKFRCAFAALFVCIEFILLMISLSVEIANGCHDQSFINSMIIANWCFVFLHAVATAIYAIMVENCAKNCRFEYCPDYYNRFKERKRERERQQNKVSQRKRVLELFGAYLKNRKDPLQFVFEELSLTGTIDFSILDRINYYLNGMEEIKTT
eukprot:UN34703